MTHDANSFFRRLLSDEKGVAAVLVAVALVALVGMGALVVDVGYFFYARSVVQASANAAALAGAQEIGTGGAPLTTATTYSSVAGEKNAVSNLTITMASGYPQLACAPKWATSSGVACSINQTPTCATAGPTCILPKGTTGANLITVSQTTNVPTFFGRIFGITSIPVSANATASASGSALTPYNVAVILDTTASMGSTATAAACGNGVTAIDCAVKGVQTLLGELWPCASGLASCAGATPVDRVALFTFPPLANAAQAAVDYGCTGTPQIATYYSGVEGFSQASTSTTLNLTPTTGSTAWGMQARGTNGITSANMTAANAFNTGSPWAAVTDAGIPTSAQATSGKTLQFPSGLITAALVGLTVQDTFNPSAISSGTTVSNVATTGSTTSVTLSKNVTATVNSGDGIVFGTTSIPAGTGTWPWWATGTTMKTTSPGTPGSATLSASPTGAGVRKGDAILVAPFYQIVGFANDYRASDTATTLTSTSNLVKGTTKGCLKTPGGLGTYYADAIRAAQTALAAQQAANVAAGEPAGQNVMILLSDGAASSNSASATDQMGPLEHTQATYECGAAVVASQNAAKNGTTVYVVYYDDGSPNCNDTAAAPGLGSKITSSCTAMQQIANAPGAIAGTFVNDQPKLFYSTDGTSTPCKATASYTSIASIFKHIVATLTNARLVPTGTS